MKRWFAGAIAAGAIGLAAHGAQAQAQTQPPAPEQRDSRLFVAGGGAELIVGSLAQAIIATRLCGVGDAEVLRRVVAAIDRRYRFCVARDPAWSGLLGDFAEQERQSLAEGATRSLGTFALRAFERTRGAEAEAQGQAAYCAALPWKMLVDPAARTPEALVASKQANPTLDLAQGFAWFDWIVGLGRDTAWTEAPCDKEFWPTFAGPAKR